MSKVNKTELLGICKTEIASHLDELNAAMLKVKESIDSEEKNSAGDKFETSRSMAQNEMELLAVQQKKAHTEYAILEQINPALHHEHVQLGTVVTTKTKVLFLAIAMGKVKVGSQDVFVLSPTSPLGQVILGKEVGFKYEIGPNKDQIVAID